MDKPGHLSSLQEILSTVMPKFETPNVLHVDSRDGWRAWLKKNHSTAAGVWLTIYKKHVPDPPILYEEAVEEAICFGWIDGQMRRIDDDTFIQHFTPRKPTSGWSESNVARAEKAIREGCMTEHGLRVYKEAMRAGRRIPSAANFVVPEDLKKALAGNREAKSNFENLARSAQLMYVYWIDTAKTGEARQKRIDETIKRVALGKRLDER